MKSKFQPREVRKTGVMQSDDFNEMNKEIRHDIFNITTELSQVTTEFKEVLSQVKDENYFLKNKIQNIENTLPNISSQVAFADFYTNEYVSFAEDTELEVDINNRAHIFNNYSAAVPAFYSNTPKTYLLKNDGEVFIPDDLQIETQTTYAPGGALEINETSKEKALDQKIKTSWYKEFVYPEEQTVDKVSVSYEIDLPQSVFTNMESNSIVINPYPNQTCEIEKVEYLLDHKINYLEFEPDMYQTDSSNNKIMVFEPLDIDKIRITLSSDTPVNIDEGHKRYLVGAQNIAVYNFSFQRDSSLFVQFNFENPIDSITDIEFGITNKHNMDGIEYKLYGVHKQTNTINEINIDENISTNYNKNILVEINFKSANILPPVLEHMLLHYIN